MSRRTISGLGWSLWALGLVFVSGTFVLGAVNGTRSLLGLAFVLVQLAFSTVGALLASRRPDNAIGWLFLACGLMLALGAFADAYATRALIAAPHSLPGGVAAAVISSWLQGPILFVAFPFLLLLFPEGLPSPRWRWCAWAAGAGAVLLGVGQALMAGRLFSFESIENPLGVHGSLGNLIGLATATGFALVVGVMLLAAVSLVRRLRRATGELRQQLKWFASAGALLAVTVTSGPILWNLGGSVGNALWPVLFGAAVTALPVATGIGILKHGLYEIDRLISRTLAYGSLTVVLAGAYVGLVLAGQALFASFAGGSNLAIAASTLVVAALFLPLRARIQAVVDRRFNRRRYDAQRTLESFGARLREELDLEALTVELRDAVAETVQPTHANLWLRAP